MYFYSQVVPLHGELRNKVSWHYPPPKQNTLQLLWCPRRAFGYNQFFQNSTSSTLPNFDFGVITNHASRFHGILKSLIKISIFGLDIISCVNYLKMASCRLVILPLLPCGLIFWQNQSLPSNTGHVVKTLASSVVLVLRGVVRSYN